MAVVVPGDSLKVMGDRLQAAAKVGKQDEWINVQAPNGVVGWVAAWFVMEITAPAGPPVEVTQPQGLTVYPIPEIGINLRASADVDSMRVDGALKNEPLAVLDSDLPGARAKIGQQDAWLYVQKAGGKRGWAAAWFVSAAPV